MYQYWIFKTFSSVKFGYIKLFNMFKAHIFDSFMSNSVTHFKCLALASFDIIKQFLFIDVKLDHNGYFELLTRGYLTVTYQICAYCTFQVSN